ncbi:hypothetical protein D3C72_1839870 [compost metagenome]
MMAFVSSASVSRALTKASLVPKKIGPSTWITCTWAARPSGFLTIGASEPERISSRSLRLRKKSSAATRKPICTAVMRSINTVKASTSTSTMRSARGALGRLRRPLTSMMPMPTVTRMPASTGSGIKAARPERPNSTAMSTTQ